ncbi:MAG: pantoate--beta-alanine ligase [Candidatus Velamenicoccus archaeovorus]
MKLITTIAALRLELGRCRKRGRRIGFVPTMGFLHEGHLSLVCQARKDNDVVVVSIFVNPIQFGPREDFKTYPRDLKRDMGLLRGFADFVFAPSARELYPEGFCTFVEVRGFSDEYCGRTRPGHFTGVATVVTKLLNIVAPDAAYFGQKDAQQAAVIRRMVEDLNVPVDIKVMPTVRESDGLAMSSRNTYLSSKERQEAVVLFQALKSAEHAVATGLRDAQKIRGMLEDFIAHTPSARIDYIEIVDKKTFERVKTVGRDALLLLAVYIGKTRLIDNVLLKARQGRG